MRVGVQVAGDILYGSGQKGFECTEIGKGNGNPPANRCGSHITAEGVADIQIGINPSETRAAVKQGFDAVVLETGFQGKRIQAQSMFPVQYDIPALAADVEVAVRIMPVGDIPISVQNQIMFDRRFVEIVQLGNVQAVCVAFCRYAAFFIPGKVLQI